MTAKLTNRKHSKVTTEKYQDAMDKLGAISQGELKAAKTEYVARLARDNKLPDHIKVIRRLGILDAEREYTDGDLADLIDAESLLQREIDHGGDFVSALSDSAGRSDNRKHQPGKRGPQFDPEKIKTLLRAYMKERRYLEIPKNQTVNACAYVTKNWGNDKSYPGDSTIMAQITALRKRPS